MHTQLDSEKLHIIKTACYRKEKWCEIKFFCSHLKLRILFRTQYVHHPVVHIRCQNLV